MNKAETIKELNYVKGLIRQDIDNGYRSIGYSTETDLDTDNRLDVITYTIQLSKTTKENLEPRNIYLTTQPIILR